VVVDVLAVVCEQPVSSLSRSTELAEVGADSLARVAVAEMVEERLAAHLPDLRIPDADLEVFRTVGDVVDYLGDRLAGDGALRQ
jgi:acyl carrier protein